MKKLVGIVALISLAGCNGERPAAGTVTPTAQNTAKVADVGQVLLRVKKEVGLFYYDNSITLNNWKDYQDGLTHGQQVCNSGPILFQIDKVKMEFVATKDNSGKNSVGLTIPIAPAPASATVGPSISGTRENTGNVDLVYTYKPLPKYTLGETGVTQEQYDKERNPATSDAVVFGALDSLRQGLVVATTTKPCFQVLGPKDDDQTLTFSVQLVSDYSLGFDFKFYIVALSHSNEEKDTYQNTITVYYRPYLIKGGKETLQRVQSLIIQGLPIPRNLLQNPN